MPGIMNDYKEIVDDLSRLVMCSSRCPKHLKSKALIWNFLSIYPAVERYLPADEARDYYTLGAKIGSVKAHLNMDSSSN